MVQHINHGVLKFSERNEIVGKEPVKQESYPEPYHEVKAEVLSIPKMENIQSNKENKEDIEVIKMPDEAPIGDIKEDAKTTNHNVDIEEPMQFREVAKPAEAEKPAAINSLKLKKTKYMFKLFRDDRRV